MVTRPIAPLVELSSFACVQCGTTDTSLRYPSGKMTRCMDCQRFYNLGVNANRPRKHQEHSPSLRLEHKDFIAWCRASERRCAFCGLNEADLPRIGLTSTIGLAIAALGIDRISNLDDYHIDNIQFCCFACNKAKGNVFDDVETRHIIGPRIGACWTGRLGGFTEPLEQPIFSREISASPGMCRSCGRGAVAMATRTTCTACAKFKSLVANSRRIRKFQSTPPLSLAVGDFLEWFESQDTSCTYCGIPEEHLCLTGVRTQVGHPLKNLGIDRVDNDAGYDPGNLAMCCYACNKVKGNVFSGSEMANHVGPAIGRVWISRGIPGLGR